MPDPRPCREPADEDCAWHSTGIGPMRAEKQNVGGVAIWSLWRRIDGEQVFCGAFPIEDEAKRLARVLAGVTDEEFQE